MSVQIGEFEVVSAPATGTGGPQQEAATDREPPPPQQTQSAQELRRMLDRMRARARRLEAD
jgi:hypothetical protein